MPFRPDPFPVTPGDNGIGTETAQAGTASRDFDGKYVGTGGVVDGLTFKVRKGRLVYFSGTVSAYCTKSGRQRRGFLFGPNLKIGSGGKFAGESGDDGDTKGEKIRGRIRRNGTAKGYASFYDRRYDYATSTTDYCYVGGNWTAKKRR